MDIREISANRAWPIRHTVMWPDQPFDFIKLPRDETDGLHYGLFVGNSLTSIISVYLDEESAQFRKFATLENDQGKGYGSQLLQWLISVLKNRGIRRVWCNARVSKSAYYHKFGLSKTKNRYEKGGIDFVVMELVFPD